MRLDMAGPTWTTGPAWTPARADFGLALFGSRLVALGGDVTGGGFFDASVLVNELDISTWPAGTWVASPSSLPSPRQANQAGFSTTGRVGGEIWSTGGLAPGFVFLADHLYRSRPTVSFTAAPLGSGSPGYPGFSGSPSDRVRRNDPASTCVTSKAYPGNFGDGLAHGYDAYRIPNFSGRSECVAVTVSTACAFIHASTYLTSFNPSDITANWIADIGASPNPSKSFSFNVPNGQTAILVVSDVGTTGCASYSVTISGSNWHTSYDTNHDFRTDFTIVRSGTNTWYTALSDGGATTTVWGGAGDVDVMGDYDGDGKADIAVWRPSDGNWYIVQSSTGTVRIAAWGAFGDIPLAGDIDGDGRDDLVIYRNGSWYTLKSSGGIAFVNWGAGTDIPILGDYDGDGKADPTVFRPSNGFWYGYLSGGGALVYGWGQNGDSPIAGNWDGDAKSDVAVYRPGTGQWFVSQSSAGSLVVPWGAAGDIPVSGDWDGDGKSEFAVWRPIGGTWYIQYAGGGTATVVWGANGDRPVGRRPGT